MKKLQFSITLPPAVTLTFLRMRIREPKQHLLNSRRELHASEVRSVLRDPRSLSRETAVDISRNLARIYEMAPWHLVALRCGQRHVVSAAVRRSRSCCDKNHGLSLVPNKGEEGDDAFNMYVSREVFTQWYITRPERGSKTFATEQEGGVMSLP